MKALYLPTTHEYIPNSGFIQVYFAVTCSFCDQEDQVNNIYYFIKDLWIKSCYKFIIT